jgi:hypothetical protein
VKSIAKALLTIASTGLLALAAGSSASAQSRFQLFLSALDAQGNPPQTLNASDIQVTEAGEAATVLSVERIDWPVKVQVLVDNGAGLGRDNLLDLRNGLRGLFEWLPADVEVSLYSIAPQPRVLVRPATTRTELQTAVDRLPFETASGRFIDALNEATRRVEGDRSNHYPVIIVVATTGSDQTVVERTVTQVMQRLEQQKTVVHTVLLTSQQISSSFGSHQTQVGIAMKNMTGGRFENISAASRLSTLLPEIAVQVAASHERQSRQFRVTLERPAGKSGPLGPVGGGVPKGYTGKFTRDGVMP